MKHVNCLKTACMWSVTHSRCAVAEARPPEQGFLPEPVRCRELMPGAGRGEEGEGKAWSVGGAQQTCRELCLVWGHVGAQEATLWSREESLASHPALPDVLCSSSGIPRGGHRDRTVAPAPRSPPCRPCHSHSARTVSLPLSCSIRIWRPGFTVEGSLALAGG